MQILRRQTEQQCDLFTVSLAQKPGGFHSAGTQKEEKVRQEKKMLQLPNRPLSTLLFPDSRKKRRRIRRRNEEKKKKSS